MTSTCLTANGIFFFFFALNASNRSELCKSATANRVCHVKTNQSDKKVTSSDPSLRRRCFLDIKNGNKVEQTPVRCVLARARVCVCSFHARHVKSAMMIRYSFIILLLRSRVSECVRGAGGQFGSLVVKRRRGWRERRREEV